MTQSIRLQWVDNLRGCGMLLVILGHTLQYFTTDFDSNHVANYIYAFHMPLFFMISGFCAYYSNYDFLKVVKKSMLQLLLPYFFWSLLFCIMLPYDLMDTLIYTPRYWFLLVLFYVRILHAICISSADLTRIPSWIISVMIIAFLGVLRFIEDIRIPCFNSIYYYMIFFVIGYHMCHNYHRMRIFLEKKWILIVMSVSFLLWGWFFKRGSVPSNISFMPGFVYFTILALIGSVACFSLFVQLLDKEISAFQFIGRNSLGFYVISGLICWLIYTYIPVVSALTIQFWPLAYLLFAVMSITSGMIVKPFVSVNLLRPLIGLSYKR